MAKARLARNLATFQQAMGQKAPAVYLGQGEGYMSMRAGLPFSLQLLGGFTPSAPYPEAGGAPVPVARCTADRLLLWRSEGKHSMKINSVVRRLTEIRSPRSAPWAACMPSF